MASQNGFRVLSSCKTGLRLIMLAAFTTSWTKRFLVDGSGDLSRSINSAVLGYLEPQFTSYYGVQIKDTVYATKPQTLSALKATVSAMQSLPVGLCQWVCRSVPERQQNERAQNDWATKSILEVLSSFCKKLYRYKYFTNFNFYAYHRVREKLYVETTSLFWHYSPV